MEDVFKKLKDEINKKIEGYKQSLATHKVEELEMYKNLEKNSEKQETVRFLILEAEKELEQLNNYNHWKKSMKE